MAAVLMLDKEAILNACEAVQDIGVCEIANYNCPGQIVITGEKAAVEACGKKLSGGRRTKSDPLTGLPVPFIPPYCRRPENSCIRCCPLMS